METFWILAVVVFTAITKMVQTGQKGVHYRLGRVRAVHDAGLHWAIPIIDYIQVVHATSQTLDIPEQRITTRDHRVLDVDANIVFQIENVAVSAVEVADVTKGVVTISELAVHQVISSRTYAELSDRKALDAALRETIESQLGRWGIRVERVGFNSLSPTDLTLELTQIREETMERRAMFEHHLAAGMAELRALQLVGAHAELTEAHRAKIRQGEEELPMVFERVETKKPFPWKDTAFVVTTLVILVWICASAPPALVKRWASVKQSWVDVGNAWADVKR